MSLPRAGSAADPSPRSRTSARRTFRPERAARRIRCLSCAKLEHVFGWRPPDWQESCSKVVERLVGAARLTCTLCGTLLLACVRSDFREQNPCVTAIYTLGCVRLWIAGAILRTPKTERCRRPIFSIIIRPRMNSTVRRALSRRRTTRKKCSAWTSRLARGGIGFRPRSVRTVRQTRRSSSISEAVSARCFPSA